MSTDELLEIAASMRASHGPEHQRHDMWEAIATFVENAAEGRLASRLDAYMAGKRIAVAYRDADTSEPVRIPLPPVVDEIGVCDR